MYRTLLTEEGFKRGMKLYFQRFDGKAVTCDDFRQAMAGKVTAIVVLMFYTKLYIINISVSIVVMLLILH